MSHFMAIAAPVLLLATTSAMANELPSRQFPENSAIESGTRPGSDSRTRPDRAARQGWRLQEIGSGAPSGNRGRQNRRRQGRQHRHVRPKLVPAYAPQRYAQRLATGERALHVHSVGKCEPPFTSAGPHFDPAQKKHGKLDPEGHHAGDMDNICVPANRNLTLKIVNKDITLEKGKPGLRVSGGRHRRGGPRRQGRLHDRPDRQCRRSHRLRRGRVRISASEVRPKLRRALTFQVACSRRRRTEEDAGDHQSRPHRSACPQARVATRPGTSLGQRAQHLRNKPNCYERRENQLIHKSRNCVATTCS